MPYILFCCCLLFVTVLFEVIFLVTSCFHCLYLNNLIIIFRLLTTIIAISLFNIKHTLFVTISFLNAKNRVTMAQIPSYFNLFIFLSYYLILNLAVILVYLELLY